MTVVVPITILAFGLTVVCATAFLVRRMLRDLPEIRQIADEELRNHIVYSVRESFELSGGKKVLAAVLPFALFIAADWVLSCLTTPDRLRSGSLGCLMLHIAGLGCLVPVVTILEYRVARKELRRFVWRRCAQHGVLVCMHCGYDLRGQTVCRCPECGKPFDPKRLSLKTGAFYPLDFWRGDR
jgi:hypothetical protein